MSLSYPRAETGNFEGLRPQVVGRSYFGNHLANYYKEDEFRPLLISRRATLPCSNRKFRNRLDATEIPQSLFFFSFFPPPILPIRHAHATPHLRGSLTL